MYAVLYAYTPEVSKISSDQGYHKWMARNFGSVQRSHMVPWTFGFACQHIPFYPPSV